MTDELPQPQMPEKRAASAVGRFLRGLLRVLSILVVGLLVGTAIYIGLVFLYNQAVLPSRANTGRLDLVETRQAQTLKLQDERLAKLDQRLTSIESQRKADAEMTVELRSKVLDMQQAIEQQNTALKRLDELESSVNTLAKELGDNQANLAGSEDSLASLRRETRVLRAMELMNRSRMYFLQNNFGLATDDVQAARQTLLSIQADAPGAEQPALAAWIARLDLALQNLPGSPVLAADDLEIAWSLMVGGLQQAPVPTSAPTPTPFATIIDSNLSPTPTIDPTTVILNFNVTPTPSPAATTTPIG